jgi:acetate kinase
MKILVINCGSSSVKYRLFVIDESGQHAELAKGLLERVGTNEAQVTHQNNSKKFASVKPIPDYVRGIAEIADHLRTNHLINDDLAGIGHRVVHGAEKFTQSAVIDANVLKGIDDCTQLAPLHNPANLAGIKACQEIFPNIPQVAVFDTAFHQTLPPEAYLYALPYEWYEKHHVRRYGFHGTSHRYVAEMAAEFLHKPLEKCNFITMHLGNGCSMAAIRQGKVIDTTMGLTPLEGLVMGSRCGDIDTAIVFHMLGAGKLTVDQVRDALEKKSGLVGISGVSRDMRDVEAAAEQGNARAQLARQIFARRVRKYLGAYLVEIGRCNAIIFTGGVGENAWKMRELILTDMEHLGITLDREKNRNLHLPSTGTAIDNHHSGIATLVIPTNEELAIARDTCKLVGSNGPCCA